MKKINPEYQQEIEETIKLLQASDEYKKFLEDEEDEDYIALREMFEPKVRGLYETVAKENPLQLTALEEALLNPDLEGLFLARILGYTVLRGVINDNYKYIRPQSHFKKVLLAICDSSNFDYIRKRIGQTIQMGFALSSDIWITNLINEFSNKRIRYFLQGQKLPKYRLLKERQIGLVRYRNQFKQDIYHTTTFPQTLSQLKTYFPSVREFLHYRFTQGSNNASIIPEIMTFLRNKDFRSTEEYLELLLLYTHFGTMSEADSNEVSDIINSMRKNVAEFDESWLHHIMNIRSSQLNIDGSSDKQVSTLIDKKIKDKLSPYYTLTDTIHSKGYIHDETIEDVRVFYHNYEGRSTINECIRHTIFNYFKVFMNNLEENEYASYFELSKIFPVYMEVFSNQQFNQSIKELCMAYVKKLLKKYTDKRGKDYQDIKKFVSTNFLDLGFMKEKEIVELFKTRRKKKKPVSS
ncbi:MAG: hypothetical protein AAFP19_16950 [Bacteroidota bacterium]